MGFGGSKLGDDKEKGGYPKGYPNEGLFKIAMKKVSKRGPLKG